MEEDFGSWMPEMHFDSQSPNLNPFGAPLDTGKQNGVSNAINSGINMGTRNVTMPAYVSSALPHLQFGHSDEPHGWFYCLPRFRQAFMPGLNFTTEEKLCAGHVKGFEEEIRPNVESGFMQKQFLVIDQTAYRTTLIYSSRFGNPAECRASWDSRLHGFNNLNEKEPLRRDLNHVAGPTFVDKVDENQGIDIESEMHEDTEEINALLYSDSDGYSTEDDEVTSTGHSPSTMTTHDNQEPYYGTSKEVGSSARISKKRKLCNDAYDDDIQFMDTAGSQIRNRIFDTGDDAESRCSNGINIQGLGEMDSLSGNKKMRKDKIQDVLSILQSMIPGGKDKDPVDLIDEAIHCLKSLKLALGLDAL
ncbi:putative transcription factor bHLH family [Lupinus albus]|uniref:Putative transcription factor bHLH family n=1 Tax=Lupinus albus TaxID=3870 RepID=A0A6A4P6D0_LUPAL|nr:putative transcription factor bHLH family [Lupinus albus]